MAEMDANSWKRVKELFGSALEREPAERSAFLAQACAADESLRAGFFPTRAMLRRTRGL